MGWLVGWLVSWLNGWHQTSPKSIKMGFKILPKSSKLRVKILYILYQDASWRALGCILVPRWSTEGSKSQNGFKNQTFSTRSWGPSWTPNRPENLSWGDPKGDHCLYRFVGSTLGAIWCQFGSNLAPTWLPKPSQNAAKLATKSIHWFKW